jgi:hypothetical protein
VLGTAACSVHGTNTRRMSNTNSDRLICKGVYRTSPVLCRLFDHLKLTKLQADFISLIIVPSATYWRLKFVLDDQLKGSIYRLNFAVINGHAASWKTAHAI